MFLVDNVVVVLIFSGILFIFFTFLNIATFARGFETSLLLTFAFFDLLFIMPFKLVNTVYNEKEKFIKAALKSKKMDDEQKELMIHTVQSRWRIFKIFYKAGVFSYSEHMSIIREWYLKKPLGFKLSFKNKFFKQKKKSLESSYIRDVKKDFAEGLCAAN
ncbi:hypothetical protein PDN20_28750 [Bacillus cereus]|uniref:hypothetical protein n=1 Tax=Bacillus cereus group TaxID=86661 RepID=UPI001F57BCE9|nr:hypothetical protein [Bacillus cereus]MDA2130068.1 hypothetical protein [Bacillus cereus]MDA2152586.1 hypothetical protein [Bacillus cereus]MEB9161410.1 hypothetical protein [Bacillus cereus]